MLNAFHAELQTSLELGMISLPGWPPAMLPLFLLRGAVGALAVIAAQLVLAMLIRSFAIPIFLGLFGGLPACWQAPRGTLCSGPTP